MSGIIAGNLGGNRMDLTQLRTFVAVAQEGHLTRAAERLHISQPAASLHVRALESYLDVKLFVRTNRGLELTSAGRRLVEMAARVLGAAADLTSIARELRGKVSGRINLGANADPVLSRIGSLVSWLRQHHPLLEPRIEMRSSLAAKQGVRAGELDAAFVLGRSFEAGLTGLTLARLAYCVVGPRQWAARLRGADLKALARLPWVVTSPGTSNYEMREQLFQKRRLKVNASVEVNNDLLLRSLIAEGVGIGLVRRDLAEAGAKRRVYFVLDQHVAETHLLFVFSAESRSDPLIQSVIQGIRTLWPGLQEAKSAV